MKYIKGIREHFGQALVFTIRDLKIFISNQGASDNYANLLIHNLMEKNEIHRITRGVYTFQDDAIVSGFAFSPFYYGLQNALSIRNIWEQETNPVVITPRKVRTGLRTIMDTNVLVRKIQRKMFFGFDLIKHYDYWIPVSDVEKTLIDFVYFKEPISEESLGEMKKRIRKDVLEKYLNKCPKQTRKLVAKYVK